MARREVVLRILGRYEDQLAQGILPKGVVSVLDQYVKADESAKRLYRTAGASAEKLFSSTALNTGALNLVRISAKQSLRSIGRAASLERQPEYEIGVFAREHLLLKPEDVSLTEDEIEENRRRLQDYRRQFESQVV